MTDNNHPITPPPALVEQWYDAIDNSSTSWKQELATQAARWGADMELDACCSWVSVHCSRWSDGTRPRDELYVARRPKPPTLKERGRKALQSIHNAVVMETGGRELDVLKEIVESLPD